MSLEDHEFTRQPDAPFVLLSNSLGTTSAIWEDCLPVLAPGFRIAGYDLPGHGGSPLPTDALSLPGLSAQVIELLDGLDVPTAHLVGTSLGAMIAMRAAIDHPQRIDSLTLLCTSARPGTPQAWRERAATVRAHGLERIAEAAVERWLTPGFRTAHPTRADRLRRQLAATSVEGYAACCELLATVDLVAQLGRIAAPTLVIAGSDDHATPPAEAQLLRDAIPDARLEIVDDAGHLAVVERPLPVARLIAAHLAATSPGAAPADREGRPGDARDG